MEEKNIREQIMSTLPNIDIASQGLRLSEKESIIYEGLKIFRPDIAAFYKDGLEIKRLNVESKSNILAHLLREIDAGLRDIFDKGNRIVEKKCPQCGKVEKSIKNNSSPINARNLYNEFKVQYNEFDYLKDVTFDKFKKHSGHIYSILSSMQLSINEPVAKEYIMVAIWFHKYAHRDNKSISSPRTERDIIKLWDRFEAVLYELLSNYRQYDQADTILSISQPTTEDIRKLRIIERSEATKRYFWGKLIHVDWLEPLYNARYFAGTNNPEPIFDKELNGLTAPYWIELFYVQNIAYQISQSADSDFTVILNIIDEICLYKKPDGTRVNNQITDRVLISLISTIPSDKILKKHFDYITCIFRSNNRGQQDSYDFQQKFIDRFIQANDKQNLLRCMSIVLLYRKSKNFLEPYQSLLESYSLRDILSEKVTDLIRICGLEGLKTCENVLNKLRKKYWYDIKAIEDHYQNGFNSDNFPRQVVKFIREFLLKLPLTERYFKTLSKYLNEDKTTIYPRIAYYIIDSRYQDLNHIFWSIDFNPLEHNHNDHELFELFQNHCDNFSEAQINQILRWIEELHDYWEDHSGEKHPSPAKKMWLTALLNINNQNITEAYNKATELYPYEIEHPGFDGWMESVVGHISPLNYDSVKEMSLPEIINYYSTYNEKPKSYRITEPTIEGLSDVIKHDTKNNLEKYTNNIEMIVVAPIGFQYTWILGLWQHCYDNKTFVDSADVLNVIYRIINNEGFWQSYTEDVSQWNKYKWFIHRALCTINCGLDCHGKMYSAENLSLVKSIILYIYQNDNDAEELGERDITDRFINSYSGELYQAMIDYTVVGAYQHEVPTDSRWDSNIKSILDTEISKNQKNPLLYYALGKEYSSLYWIDKEWIGRILPINNMDNWSGFMTGFHFHHNTVATPTFEQFCESGQYEKFFQNRELFEAPMQKIVIQYLCVAFYYDGINFDIDSPLFAKILRDKNRSDYENIIHFFSTTDKQKIPAEKVRELWRQLFNINKGLEDEVSRYFIGESYRWLKYFDNIDDEINEWLLLSIVNLQPLSHSHVLRRLSGFTKTNPDRVGELTLALVTAESTIPHSYEFEKITEDLFESGDNEIAKQIANMCLQKGYLGLRDIVHKYE